MPKINNLIVDVATVAAALCALSITGLVVWERFIVPPRGVSPEPKEIADWHRYASAGNRLGPKDAIVTVVEFGDYQCPACRSVEPLVHAFRERYPNDVAVVYRHWPLPQHPLAYPAARAAECASDQAKFEPFHQLLYGNPDWFADPKGAFVKFAEAVGVPDLQLFESCISDLNPSERIEKDIAAVTRLGGIGTPTFLINDLLLGSFPDSSEWDDMVSRARSR